MREGRVEWKERKFFLIPLITSGMLSGCPSSEPKLIHSHAAGQVVSAVSEHAARKVGEKKPPYDILDSFFGVAKETTEEDRDAIEKLPIAQKLLEYATPQQTESFHTYGWTVFLHFKNKAVISRDDIVLGFNPSLLYRGVRPHVETATGSILPALPNLDLFFRSLEEATGISVSSVGDRKSAATPITVYDTTQKPLEESGRVSPSYTKPYGKIAEIKFGALRQVVYDISPALNLPESFKVPAEVKKSIADDLYRIAILQAIGRNAGLRAIDATSSFMAEKIEIEVMSDPEGLITNDDGERFSYSLQHYLDFKDDPAVDILTMEKKAFDNTQGFGYLKD